ncbi:unnamed protein product [Mytilus coruscus]|uniref:Uncharacterized protein n=1 Tax=Mytilus coruscus TaxID=42192 RepID=A0A6J8DXB1_MYTCO|nr:unnamed protein product [Mytilus coruscus]
MEEMPDFDIGGGEKLIEMDSYSEEDLLGWLFKDNLQNIELVELNIAPENPGLAHKRSHKPHLRFQWCMEALDQVLDFATTETEELNNVLGKFYAEATPKFSEKRGKEMSTAQSKEYHKNSMKNIRAAINRHIHDLDRDIDIVRDKEFRKANETLDGKLKKNLEKGLSRPTKHKQIITMNDLEKINSYLYSSDDPIILRFRVWYNIAMHFVTRGIEFHH